MSKMFRVVTSQSRRGFVGSLVAPARNPCSVLASKGYYSSFAAGAAEDSSSTDSQSSITFSNGNACVGATSSPPSPIKGAPNMAPNITKTADGGFRTLLYDGEEEILTEKQMQEKQELIKELTKRLSGPLADEHGNVPTGKDRPIAIEVDGPSHFYANSEKYTAYSKLKHRLLSRMGYKMLHVPYFEWRRLRGKEEREDYMRRKLNEEPSEFLDPEDAKYYEQQQEVQS